MLIASRTSSTTTCRTTASRTFTGSVEPGAPVAVARRSCSLRRASATCCASSSARPASRIEQMSLPSIADVNEQRVAKFKQRITAAVEAGESAAFRELIEEIEREQNMPAIEIAAALASLLQGGAPLLLTEKADEGRAAQRRRSTLAAAARRPMMTVRPRPGRGRAEKQERRKEKYGSREGRRERLRRVAGPVDSGESCTARLSARERDDAPPRKKRGGPHRSTSRRFVSRWATCTA